MKTNFKITAGAIMFLVIFAVCNRGNDKTATAETAQTETVEAVDDIVDDVIDANDPSRFIPSGYQFVDIVNGDLNRDGYEDRVLIVAKNPVGHQASYEVERGIIILFSSSTEVISYEPVLQNLTLFGVCDEFEACNVQIQRGNLILGYEYPNGNKYWTFRYNSNINEFELIGIDEVSDGADSGSKKVSINHLTKKMLTTSLIDRHEEKWEDIIVDRLIRLSEIENLKNVTGYQTQFARIVGSWTSEESFWLESAGANFHKAINIRDDGTITISFYGRHVGKLVPRGENNFTITNMVYHIEGEEEPIDDGILEYIPESNSLKYDGKIFVEVGEG